MLDDRSYMQSSYEPAKRYPAVVVLMGVCGVVFLLQLLTRTPGFPSLWDKYFFLSQVGVGSGFLWRTFLARWKEEGELLNTVERIADRQEDQTKD